MTRAVVVFLGIFLTLTLLLAVFYSWPVSPCGTSRQPWPGLPGGSCCWLAPC